jgi:hypothetical protein
MANEGRARVANTMGFGLQRVSPVASQAGWFMRIKRAIADHGDLAIRGAANADASARRCHACSGVMPAPVSCLLRCDCCVRMLPRKQVALYWIPAVGT